MPAFVLPQSSAFQDFNNITALQSRPLRAHISGPHAYLVRFAETGEQANGHLGFYDNVVATDYALPTFPTGAVLDESYLKVWMKKALLRYFTDSASGGSSIVKTSGYNNRLHAATLNFAANGDDYPRAAAFYDRDVAVGDVVKVRATNTDGDAVTLWTTVRDLIGDPVAADVGDADDDADNAAAQSASTSIVQVAGANNCVTLTADATDYDGLPSGDITETYDILVTGSSTNGDYTTATIRIISGSGEDDDDDVTPAAAGSPTTIGSRGLTVTFNEADSAACSASASEDDVSADDLIVGQRWQVTVNQAFTPATATSAGTYDGDGDTTYIVTVSRGGLFGLADTTAQPQITISTTDGTDLSGPTNVADDGDAIDVGTRGVTISFSGAGLRKGDRYHIAVTAEFEGPMRTIVLASNMDSDIAAGTEVDLDLYILKNELQISENRTGFAPTVNWSISGTTLTVAAGIIAYDSTWTDDGTPLALDVYSESSKNYGDLFVEYRAWLQDLCDDVGSATTDTLDTVISGALHPDNPLKWGVSQALGNSNDIEVKFTGVCDPDDVDSWATAVATLVGRDDVYGLVPLTRNTEVLALYEAHVDAMSTAERKLWRRLWINLEGLPEIPLVSAGSTVTGYTAATTSDGEVCVCVIEDDPDTTGSQYTVVRCPAGNGKFVTNGVRAGDIVRTLYTSDGFGGTVYSEYVVDSVVSEDQLLLQSGPDAAVNVAAKTEIWRNLTEAEEGAALGAVAAAYANKRVSAVWPDTIESSGTTMAGYFACAALAGLVSGILPHQGRTNLEVSGFTSVDRTIKHFSPDTLDVMESSGVEIITEDPVSGTIYVRKAVTTAPSATLDDSEEMIVRNVDSIQYRFREIYGPFVGIANVVDSVQGQINIETRSLIGALKAEAFTSKLGGQLLEGTLTALHRHAVLRNVYVVALTFTVPVAVDSIDVQMTI